MALKNLLYLVAIAVFLQMALANPVLVRRWETGRENEVLKETNRDSPETNYVDEFVVEEVRETEVLEVEAETVPVPAMTNTDHVRFIHDFNYNKTAIVDAEHQRCFVMELDLERYALPTSLLDLVWKLNTDYYSVNMEVVRRNMRVVLPPLDDFENLGLPIALSCVEFHTYWLVNVDGELVLKRSISEESHVFGEKVGKKMMEFNILNMEEVTRYEGRS